MFCHVEFSNALCAFAGELIRMQNTILQFALADCVQSMQALYSRLCLFANGVLSMLQYYLARARGCIGWCCVFFMDTVATVFYVCGVVDHILHQPICGGATQLANRHCCLRRRSATQRSLAQNVSRRVFFMSCCCCTRSFVFFTSSCSRRTIVQIIVQFSMLCCRGARAAFACSCQRSR